MEFLGDFIDSLFGGNLGNMLAGWFAGVWWLCVLTHSDRLKDSKELGRPLTASETPRLVSKRLYTVAALFPTASILLLEIGRLVDGMSPLP